MSKYKIIALIGESGCGKDTIKQYLCGLHADAFHPIIMTTTRPKRDYEKDGKDYHFIEPNAFAEKIYNGDLLEAQIFNDWAYGLDRNDLIEDKLNIGAFSIASVETLIEQCPEVKIIPIRIVTDDKTRLLRAIHREENPNYEEICRRFLSDKKDFAAIEFDYWTIPNDSKIDTTCDMLLDLLHTERILG